MGLDAEYGKLVIKPANTGAIAQGGAETPKHQTRFRRGWERLRFHYWGVASTVFLSTCVGALILALAGPVYKLNGIEQPGGFGMSAPETIHIGGLTMHIADAGASTSSGFDSLFKNGLRFDLMLLIPETIQSHVGRRSNDNSLINVGLDLQTLVSITVSSGSEAPNKLLHQSSLDDLPQDAAAKNHGLETRSLGSGVLALRRCFSPSYVMDDCEARVNLGGGFFIRYALSHILSKTPDIQDRLGQLATLFGFSDGSMPSHPAIIGNSDPVKIAAREIYHSSHNVLEEPMQND